MPKKLTYEYVAEYIKNKGDELISNEYVNNRVLLDIKCGKCNSIYQNTYGRITMGFLHAYCSTGLPFGGYKTPIRLKPVICESCKIQFQPKRGHQKLCSILCQRKYEQTDVYRKNGIKNGEKGGKISATRQSRRSKNEVYFSELCASRFEITTNEPFFDGWDADVIIHSEKVAILWNGQWHYKQISKTQSLNQVQARDKVKTAIIEKYGYVPYVIKDMGKYNKKFVEQEFETFQLMRIEIV
jgi:hypothetical protein